MALSVYYLNRSIFCIKVICKRKLSGESHSSVDIYIGTGQVIGIGTG